MNTAIIAAGAALSGVLVTSFVAITISFFDRRHKKHVLLREKYEEMMFLFQDSLGYFAEVHRCTSLDTLFRLDPPAQTGKAYGLALLYFPSLVEPLSRYTHAQISMYNSVVELFDDSVPASAGAQTINADSHRRVIDAYKNDKNAVMDALVLNAKKYTKA